MATREILPIACGLGVIMDNYLHFLPFIRVGNNAIGFRLFWYLIFVQLKYIYLIS